MAVPAWTAREWRPLARDLYAHVVDKHSNAPSGCGAPSVSDEEHAKRLVLLADKLVAKLYSHRYMDITPQQISNEVQELAKKMEIHQLPVRAHRLRELATSCEYRVVKMLMELAQAPTHASDEQVTVDHAAPLEALQAWNRLQTPSKQAQKAQQKARDDAALAAKMESELLHVAWEDDWWNDRDNDGDDASDDLDDALDMGSEDLDEDDWLEVGAMPGIASRLLRGEDHDSIGLAGKDGGDVDMDESNGKDEGSTDGLDDEDVEDEEDAMLLAYYPRASDTAEKMETQDHASVGDDCRHDVQEGSFLSMKTPRLLLPFVEAHNESKRTAHVASSSTTRPSEPRRVVHERVLVDAVFYALQGVPSPLFEFRRVQSNELFAGDLYVAEISATSLLVRGLAVSHLSPLTLASIAQKVANAASDLQFLRGVATFLRASSSQESRSSTAEGLANELFKQIRRCEHIIDATYDGMNETAKGAVTLSASPTECFDPTITPTSTPILLPTLLGALGSFKEMFAMLSWLRSMLVECLQPFKNQSRVETRAAHLSSVILSGLYRQLQEAFIEFPSVVALSAAWDPYEILAQLFTGALVPYLDAMDQLLFRKGYDDRIPLHRELFFVGLHNDRSKMMLSPRSAAQRLLDETFEGAMSAVMPFRVDKDVVPVFLESLVKPLSEALESRQILNQYQNQHALQLHQEGLKPPTPALSELFLADFGAVLGASSVDHHGLRSTRATTPFDAFIRHAVIHHIQKKCVAINGTIANLFRDKLHFREHIEVIRLYLLMHQQDVFTSFGQYLIEQMQMDPVGWARSELLNTALQDAIQRLHTEGLLTTEQREIAARLSIRVDTKELEKLRITRHVDIMALRHLQFKFSTPQPVRVLFSGSIVHKYSTLAILLLQVKVAELTLTNFKQGFRHRLCFLEAQDPLRSQLVRLADMLHYTRAVLNYLANQMTGDAWSKVENVFAKSQSIRQINEAHDEYLDKMLNSFFALKKHEGFTRQFLQNFNDIIAFVSRVDEFVRTVERNMTRFFQTVERAPALATKNNYSSRRGLDGIRRDHVPNDDFRVLFAKLMRHLKNPESNYENQLHVITIVLDAMVKNGASPHVNELLLLLTFNGYRSPSRPRSSSTTSSLTIR